MSVNRKLSDRIIITAFCSFLFAIGLKNIRNLNEIIVLNDEFGYWGIAASLAHYDWKNLMGLTPYYGFGYPFILGGLLWTGMSMVSAYKIAIIFNVLMLIFSYLLAVYCGRKLFPEINSKIIIIGSFIVICYSNTIFQSQIAWAETYLYFLFWCLLALVIAIQQKCTILKMVLLAAVAGIMFMTHQRTLGILIALGITLIMIFFCKRPQIKVSHFFCFVITAVVMYLLYKNIKTMIQTNYWSDSVLGQINDFTLTTTSVVNSLSMNSVINLFEGVGGKAFYFLTSGGILFFIGIWEILSEVKTDILKFCKGKNELKWKTIIYIFILLAFLSALGISVLFMINNYTRLDLAVYGRYIENTIGPILLIGIISIWSKGLNAKKIICFCVSVGISGIITESFIAKVSSNNFVDVSSVGASIYFGNYDKYIAVCAMSVVAILIAFGIYWLNRYSKTLYIILSACIVGANWLYVADTVAANVVISQQTFRKRDNFDIAEMLKASEVTDIYFIQGVDQFAFEVKYLQFWIPDITIHVISEEELKDIPDDSIWIYENSTKKDKKFRQDACIVRNAAYTIATQKDSIWADKIKNWK